MKITQVNDSRALYCFDFCQYTQYGTTENRSEYVVLLELKNDIPKRKYVGENVVHFVVHSDDGVIHEYKTIK